ncbi:MAG TPA: hypothetical protein VNN73_08085 [Blastocatellia bacterium]|nr:hypothetical protein [Blastocatellia bacterium]
MFGRAKQKSSKTTQSATANNRRLHSIAGLLKERAFAGGFDVAGSSYKFNYEPSRAAVAGRRLELTGRLTVTDARGQARLKEGVRATLLSTQGGIGAAPVRRQVMVGGVAASAVATSGRQQQLAGGAAGVETKKTDEQSKTKPLPEVDSTGSLSFCGVIYFQFEPLDGRTLGVAADLSRLQLNARLAPTDDTGRALHGIYCTVVDALYGKEVNEPLATASISELNKLLAEK